MNSAEISESLTQALWDIERYVDFHADEEYWDEFPRLRAALAEARQLTQAIMPPVVLLQEVYQIPEDEELIETLRINVNHIGARFISSVHVAVTKETPACDQTGRPTHPPTPTYEFPPEDLPNWTRVERALRAHSLFSEQICTPPAYEEIYPDGLPPSYQTSDRTSGASYVRAMMTSPPPCYEGSQPEEIASQRDNDLSSAVRYGPIEWPSRPFSSESDCFMANAVPARYEDYVSDNE